MHASVAVYYGEEGTLGVKEIFRAWRWASGETPRGKSREQKERHFPSRWIYVVGGLPNAIRIKIKRRHGGASKTN